MYYVHKKMEISAAHRLALTYESKCANFHGHNWVVTVHCKSDALNENGMVTDFTKIKESVHGRLDHSFLNEVLKTNPTAENIAKWICDTVPNCYAVDVQESEGNVVTYSKE